MGIEIQTYSDLKRVSVNGVIMDSIYIRGDKIKKLKGVTEVYGDVGIGCPPSYTNKKTVLKDFGDLTIIHGNLWIAYGAGDNLCSLNNISTVDGDVSLGHSSITSIGNLHKVGGSLKASNTNITSIDGLRFVGGNLRLPATLKGFSTEQLTVGGKLIFAKKRKYNVHYDVPKLNFSNGLTLSLDRSWLTPFGKEHENQVISRFWEIINEDFTELPLLEKEMRSKCRKVFRMAENDVRLANGHKKVGEGWVSETTLYNKIKNHFRDIEVIQHGSPIWLGRQHLDVYIPQYNIGIEYQGVQHTSPVNYFGGEPAFEKTKERDRRKKWLCAKNGCDLIEVMEGYEIQKVIADVTAIICKKVA